MPLIELRDATLERVAAPPLSLTLESGAAWAITGPTGSGKSSLLAALAGRRRLRSGTIRWPAGRDAVRFVPFGDDSKPFRSANRYLQQRFNWIDADENVSLAEFVGDPAALDRVGLSGLGARSLLVLSNGQLRRARLAQALVAKPQALVLDEPLAGLDASGRAEIIDLLRTLVREGLALVSAFGAFDPPAWVTLRLELSGSVRTASVSDRLFVGQDPGASVRGSDGPPIIEMHAVRVAYAGRPVVDGVDWTVRAGERWAVVGPNGAGKTTLLSLVTRDHPQIYRNDIRLFGKRPGPGVPIAATKALIGHLSPELHAHFPTRLSAWDAVATGFTDSIHPRTLSEPQRATLDALLGEWLLSDLAGRPFGQLSVGQQRLILLARALVKRPPLVILDEPFGGLDVSTASHLRGWLDHHLTAAQTLLFTSHTPADIPASVSRWLRMRNGRVELPASP